MRGRGTKNIKKYAEKKKKRKQILKQKRNRLHCERKDLPTIATVSFHKLRWLCLHYEL